MRIELHPSRSLTARRRSSPCPQVNRCGSAEALRAAFELLSEIARDPDMKIESSCEKPQLSKRPYNAQARIADGLPANPA